MTIRRLVLIFAVLVAAYQLGIRGESGILGTAQGPTTRWQTLTGAI